MAKKKPTKKTNKRESESLYKGVIEITRSGMGYVIVDKLDKDIMVRPNDFATALHGDLVRVKIVKDNAAARRMQGKVVEVVSRKQMEFLGRIEMSRGFAFFIPDTDKPMPDIYIPLDALNGAEDNQRVVARITRWETNKKPEGEVVELLDATTESDLAMKDILLKAGFPLSFSDDAMEEAARLPETVTEDDLQNRRDLRDILTFTIDPVDAKDFDDALSFRKFKNGKMEIGVHIADVSHFVRTGSELDKESYTRATSVYLPDRVNPMLPEQISNVLCSLRPQEDKLAFSVVFQFDKNGKMSSHWIGKTIIHSDHRFTYEEVQEIIESGTGPYNDVILTLNKIAQGMRAERFAKGAINFSSQEIRFKLDDQARPVGIIIKESKEAHQLIEEFMLLANRTVAEAIAPVKVNKKPVPFPYRVHDTPDEQKLVPFIAYAKKYGHEFDLSSPAAIAKSFNSMLDAARGKPEQHVLEQLGIRTMAKAIYTPDNIGHYGLGFEHYCHFTSPIRRYPDILVHRILEQFLEGKISADKKMEEKCRHSSERERAAMEAERAANKYKQVEYMLNFLGEEFEAVISGVSTFGFWAETVEHKCEGLVSISSLSDFDDFRLVESDYCLVGLRSGRQFRMGDKVTVRIVAANLEKRQLDYEWVITTAIKEESSSGAEKKKKITIKKSATKSAKRKKK